ncbi:hypothetical protein NQZ68_016562 [Dissostichus eleginoides]|nr:hypothetical protein NQZ68_016562 [Dissostichus eleginoides]
MSHMVYCLGFLVLTQVARVQLPVPRVQLPDSWFSPRLPGFNSRSEGEEDPVGDVREPRHQTVTESEDLITRELSLPLTLAIGGRREETVTKRTKEIDSEDERWR